MIITIDGLGVNGKSTLAKMLSTELNYKNFNTGAIYRCIALKIIEEKLNINEIDNILKNIKNIKIDFEGGKVFFNGKDVTAKIRTEEISYHSTKWATIPEIKDFVRKYQKDFIKKNNTVMEGRDIATRIAPNADFKFYLYSTFETRVKRLWEQNKMIKIETIRNDLRKRDDLDINEGNFIKPVNSIEIDTTNLSINDVYNIMISKIRKLET